MLVGYRFGMLSRPIGYGGSGYGYNYIHKDRYGLVDLSSTIKTLASLIFV